MRLIFERGLFSGEGKSCLGMAYYVIILFNNKQRSDRVRTCNRSDDLSGADPLHHGGHPKIEIILILFLLGKSDWQQLPPSAAVL